jgi:hypothetical protein
MLLERTLARKLTFYDATSRPSRKLLKGLTRRNSKSIRNWQISGIRKDFQMKLGKSEHP